MANFNMNPYSGALTTPMQIPGADKGYGGKLISLTATITMASQAAASTLKCFKANPGWLWMGGFVLTNTSLSTATFSIGGSAVTGTLQAAQYRAAAVLTTIDVPQPFMNNISASTPWLTDPVTPYSAPEEFVITTATAALPASGILLVVGNFMIS